MKSVNHKGTKGTKKKGPKGRKGGVRAAGPSRVGNSGLVTPSGDGFKRTAKRVPAIPKARGKKSSHKKAQKAQKKSGRGGRGGRSGLAKKQGKGPAVIGVVKRSIVPASWVDLLRLIPGYDPIKTAGQITGEGAGATHGAGGCVFDERAAERVIGFVEECCRHVKGHQAGQLIKLEPWQKAVYANKFGWKRKNGLRRYRESFEGIPRKNGKTTMSAPVALYLTCADGEKGAEVYSAAGDRDQAALVYQQAEGMVVQEPELSRRLVIYKSTKTIHHEASNSSYKAISSESLTKHGYNTHGLVVDELHTQPNRDLVDTLTTSMGSRLQPLMTSITTRDFERVSICNEKHDFAEKVRDGVIEDAAFLPVIYAAGADEDWTDEAVWRRVNPNLGVSFQMEYLLAEFAKAKEQPSFENTFKRLYLNMKTQADVVWIPMEAWDASGQENQTTKAQRHEEEEYSRRGAENAENYHNLVRAMVGKACWGALDMSSTADLTAFSLWFPEECVLLSWAFVPEASAEQRERRDRVPYLTWARQGFIELTEGNVVDQRRIQARVREIARDYLLQDIGIDPWNAAAITQGLMDDGFNVVEFRQGFMSMNAPAKEFEKLVTSGRLRHGGHPVLRWCVGNTMVESDPAGNIKPSKKKSTGRIDCVVAGVMAVGRAMAGAGVSGYEKRGVEWI